MRRLPALLALLTFGTVSYSQPQEAIEQFRREVNQLKSYYHIPGLAVVVKKGNRILDEQYLGYGDRQSGRLIDSTSLFPIASLTKVFTSVLLMQLVEQGKLSLDDPLNRYVQNSSLPNQVLIKHLMSHTSQGTVGEYFQYSSRFSLLTRVLEKASGMGFAQLLQSKILDPIELKHTFLLADSSVAQHFQATLVKGYLFDGQTKNGFYDYGYSAAGGLVSTALDLAKFDDALNQNRLISQASKQLMFTPFTPSSPYGLGIFSQPLGSQRVIWAYGQYDCFASLFIKIPAKDLTLIMTANNNLPSDAPRLIYGNLMGSLFALGFLKNFVFSCSQNPLLAAEPTSVLPPKDQTEQRNKACALIDRQRFLAQALSESFLGQSSPQAMSVSKDLLNHTFKLYPDSSTYAPLPLLHNLIMLKSIAQVDTFDNRIVELGQRELQLNLNNPYANYYLGTYYQLNNQTQQPLYYFQKIVSSPNLDTNWYTRLATSYLTAQGVPTSK